MASSGSGWAVLLRSVTGRSGTARRSRSRSHGLDLVPHVGDFAGPAAVRRVIDELAPERICHRIRAAEEPTLLNELAQRGTVLDVCLTSNLRTGTVPSLREHPLPTLLAAGVSCSVSTDNPALFETDLEREDRLAIQLGGSPHTLFEAGLTGALCNSGTRTRLEEIGHVFDWSTLSSPRR